MEDTWTVPNLVGVKILGEEDTRVDRRSNQACVHVHIHMPAICYYYEAGQYSQ